MRKEEKSILYSILTLQCPHCRETSMYENPNTYSLNKLGKNKKYCDKCGADLQPEPGFYFGAAYVSWGLTVATWITVLVTLQIMDILGWIEFSFFTHPVTFLLSGLLVSLVIFPYFFRLSRSIWAHLFIKYRRENLNEPQ